jgi:hypothetical protein
MNPLPRDELEVPVAQRAPLSIQELARQALVEYWARALLATKGVK